MNCSKTPVVVLSPGKAVCKEYDISLRNVKELLDGGVLQNGGHGHRAPARDRVRSARRTLA